MCFISIKEFFTLSTVGNAGWEQQSTASSHELAHHISDHLFLPHHPLPCSLFVLWRWPFLFILLLSFRLLRLFLLGETMLMTEWSRRWRLSGVHRWSKYIIYLQHSLQVWEILGGVLKTLCNKLPLKWFMYVRLFPENTGIISRRHESWVFCNLR